MDRKKQDRDRIDPNLDTPSEANTQKHINFLAEEEDTSDGQDKSIDDLSKQRKQQWQDGIDEGRQSRDQE